MLRSGGFGSDWIGPDCRRDGRTLGRPSPDGWPSPEETLRTVGRRLSGSCSEHELTAIATRGAAILDRLEPAERAALGRGYLRFQVDRPVIVDVAVSDGLGPVLAGRSGIPREGQALVESRCDLADCSDAPSIAAGSNWGSTVWIGSRSAHYVVFIRPSEGP